MLPKDLHDTILSKLQIGLGDSEEIQVLDESKFHQSHPQRPKGKFHIHLKIKNKELNKMTLINRHRKIYTLLENEIKIKIHALKISAISN
ncbi:BolA family transcriptional regulator [Gammaproteobacteria bacterium]|nr:BolA family transcriptional regulator [Gammaproteobacteria bacterium]